jgi:hypothetical protein
MVTRPLNSEEHTTAGDAGQAKSADASMVLPMVAEILAELRQEVSGGLLYAHHRANGNTSKVLEVTSFAYALIELLVEKGLLKVEELDERKRQVATRLAEKFRDNGMGVVRQEPEYDKYNLDGSVEIDCESRLQFCHAACCRLQFALSRQDVEEGVLKWDFSRPYMIKQDHDGYCAHLDRQGCTEHDPGLRPNPSTIAARPSATAGRDHHL